MSEMRLIIADEMMTFDNALVSGKLNDPDQTPSSLYNGELDLQEIHSALYYANRTVIKLLVEELDVSFEHVDDFLLSAVSEAITKEYNALNKDDSDLDVRKIYKED